MNGCVRCHSRASVQGPWCTYGLSVWKMLQGVGSPPALPIQPFRSESVHHSAMCEACAAVTDGTMSFCGSLLHCGLLFSSSSTSVHCTQFDTRGYQRFAKSCSLQQLCLPSLSPGIVQQSQYSPASIWTRWYSGIWHQLYRQPSAKMIQVGCCSSASANSSLERLFRESLCCLHAGNLDDLLKLHVREAVRSRSHAGSGNVRSLPYSR